MEIRLNKGFRNIIGMKPITKMKPAIRYWGNSMPAAASVTGCFISLRGVPRKTTPNAFVKQKMARPPMRVREIMASSKVIDRYTLP